MEDIVQLDIPNTMLQKAIIVNKDTIGRKYEFLTTKGNEFIQVDPPTAKFAGFEINKLNTIKIKVINKATIPQRIHVLPLESNNFSIKMNKKGILPTGMAEELLISFKPTEYKYFFDTLRINTETENILVPIHAYPVLDRNNLRNIFPRLIDFGTIIVGETNTITSSLVCKIPINFEFEFEFTKHHQDMRISPRNGIIPGNGSIEISINYTSSTNTTIICEAELKISQFDFEPLKIRLMGSGRYEDPAQNKKKLVIAPQSQPSPILMRPYSNPKLKKLDRSTLESGNNGQFAIIGGSQINNKENLIVAGLTHSVGPPISADEQVEQKNKLSGPVSVKLNQSLRSTSERNFKVRNIVTSSVKNRTTQGQQEIEGQADQQNEEAEDDETRERMAKEKEFIEKCNAVLLMDKNKDIKFFQCVGDEALTQLENDNIVLERTNFHQAKIDSVLEEGTHRYSKKLNTDQVMLTEENQEQETICTWDTDKNDSLKMRRIILNEFMKAGTRIILKMRMENRLIKLKNLICDCKNKQDVRKLVTDDWQKAEYAGVGKKEFIAFEFDWQEDNADANLFSIQYESSNQFMEFKFDVTPRNDFVDIDLHDYTLFPRNEVEAMNYTTYDRPLCPNHPPIEVDRENRTGAEWEYAQQGRVGAYKELKETQGVTDEMAKTYLKPLEMEPHLFITAHNTLRPYTQFKECTEIDEIYSLQPEILSIQDSLDPQISGEFFALKNEFLGKTPGLYSRFAMHQIYSENIRYLPKLLKIPADCGYIKSSEKYCSSSLKEKDYDDNLTDDDSDGEESPDMETENVDDFLKSLEENDKIVASVRERNIQRLPFDESEDVQNSVNDNLNQWKKQCFSTLPSISNNYNKATDYSRDKLIIL